MSAFWDGFEKRALSPGLLRRAADMAESRAAHALEMEAPHIAQKFMDQSGRLAAGAAKKAKGVFQGISKETAPALDYQKTKRTEMLAKRIKAHVGGNTMDYATMSKGGPTVTPNVTPRPVAKTPDFGTWSKINQAKRAKQLEQQRTGVIRD